MGEHNVESRGALLNVPSNRQDDPHSNRALKEVTPDPKKKQRPLSIKRVADQKRKSLSDKKEPNGRRNLDKRTVRLSFSKDFKRAVDRLKTPTNEESSNASRDSLKPSSPSSSMGIYIRKRPLFAHETSRSDYDVVSVENPSEVMILNCVVGPDMKQKFIKPVHFNCTNAFGEECSNEHVYDTVVGPIVKEVFDGGKRVTIGTIFMYGQTGSGKSFTMTGIEKCTIEDLFSNKYTHHADEEVTVNLQFVELTGKKITDLLVKASSKEEIKLGEEESGAVKLMNAKTITAFSQKELEDAINRGKARRKTEATDVNGVSSRSHAVCIMDVLVTYQGKTLSRGLITLIDCAGSERRNDTLYHSTQRQKETAEINSSLYALKECIRARMKLQQQQPNLEDDIDIPKVYIPYRSSNLTRILRESFEQKHAKLCVIATIAPNATDTEHTIETLKTVTNIAGGNDERGFWEDKPTLVAEERLKNYSSLIHPKEWTNKQMNAWLRRRKLVKGNYEAIAADIDGKAIMKMSVTQLHARLFKGDKDTSQKVFKALRKESDKVSKIQMRERVELSAMRKGNLQ